MEAVASLAPLHVSVDSHMSILMQPCQLAMYWESSQTRHRSLMELVQGGCPEQSGAAMVNPILPFAAMAAQPMAGSTQRMPADITGFTSVMKM